MSASSGQTTIILEGEMIANLPLSGTSSQPSRIRAAASTPKIS